MNYCCLKDPKLTTVALRTLNYGNYGIFLMMGNAGCISSTVGTISNENY